ncbi:X-box-binding protein 1 isoform X2 [Tympanuchus pallidicinctus]|uniref:X-box-binding protein 1 isoform X2 n=1 Tax=Tympanuchus pallidicinctus TaxID=109042 RepID=UPI0022871976|nr:X-box-binding protein 1 isoform X2 [Tympanuchus pallidicinctus]
MAALRGAPRLLLFPGDAADSAAGRRLSVVLPAGAAPGSAEAPPPARKRQRLTHLSPEEKALRRKLKNRVAAQSARDRKKARMTELEQQVVELEEENQRLLRENQRLREQTGSLSLENQELRCRLGLDALKTEPECESTQVQAQLSPFLTTSTWILMAVTLQILSLISCSDYWTFWTQKCFSNVLIQNHPAWRSWRKRCVEKQIPYRPPPLPLWGPHQLSWRPLMNS